MSCPTCDHTMQSIGYCDGGTVWLCPRCGTVKHPQFNTEAEPRIYVPKLVERCREFAMEEYAAWDSEQHKGVVSPPERWKTLGIAKSINKPEDRP